MENKWIMRIRLGAIFISILITIAAVVLFTGRTQDALQDQTQMTLKDVAKQNVVTVEKEIEERQNFLSGMAKELQSYSGEDADDILEILKPYVEIYNLKRMGYVRSDGIVNTTDGYKRDLSFRDFFVRGMRGEATITGVIKDSLGVAEDINVFSVPVYQKDEKKAKGVLFATYRTKAFEELLNVESFDGKGYSLIIKPDGTIIVDSEKSPVFGEENLFTALAKSDDDDNQSEIEKIKSVMKSNKSGTVSLAYKNKQCLYYTPMDNDMEDEQWYMLTIVPEKTFHSRISPVVTDINILLVVIILVLLFITVIYSVSYGKDKNVLLRLAYKDPLTGGDNYACFAMKMKNTRVTAGYLVAMDLNEFKIINSTCGVLKGDETLQCIWRIIDNNLNQYELAAHINADHFVLFLLADNRDKVIERIEKISKEIAILSGYLQIPDLIPYYGIYQTKGFEEVEISYNKANQAKHLVKGRRNKNYAFHEDVDYEQTLENKRLEDCFEEAITNNRFEVWYQPKYSADDAMPVGAEALVRWREKDGTLIPPYKFIPLFEKNGMIARLDEYVFENVCRQQKLWQQEGKRILPVSINISRASLYYSSIVEKYTKIVKNYDIPIEYIQLEITESAMVENAEVKELIERFHDAGFKLLLDDFGNGYSSFSALNTLHFDVLKVDKSLIDYIGNTDGEKLLKCIIELAKSLGLKTTAEGVESIEQVEFLQDLQCNDIQGFYFSKPLPMNNFEMLL